MKELLPILFRSKCVVNSTNVRSFLRGRDIPEKFIIYEMYPKSVNKHGYGHCVMAHHCVPITCKDNAEDIIYPANNETGCLSKEHLEKYKCNENLERPFQVNYIHI